MPIAEKKMWHVAVDTLAFSDDDHICVTVYVTCVENCRTSSTFSHCTGCARFHQGIHLERVHFVAPQKCAAPPSKGADEILLWGFNQLKWKRLIYHTSNSG